MRVRTSNYMVCMANIVVMHLEAAVIILSDQSDWPESLSKLRLLLHCIQCCSCLQPLQIITCYSAGSSQHNRAAWLDFNCATRVVNFKIQLPSSYQYVRINLNFNVLNRNFIGKSHPKRSLLINFVRERKLFFKMPKFSVNGRHVDYIEDRDRT